MPNSKYNETLLTQEKIFSGKILNLTVDEIRLPNGGTSVREVVHHNGGASVVAINDKNEIAIVRQFRYAIGRETIEIPAGKIEPGEPPIETAKRELEEEAACIAGSIQPFGQIVPTCAYCTEIIYIFLAKDLQPAKQNLDEDEFVDVEWMPLDTAAQLVLDGTIQDSKTVSGILRAKLLKDRGEL